MNQANCNRRTLDGKEAAGKSVERLTSADRELEHGQRSTMNQIGVKQWGTWFSKSMCPSSRSAAEGS